MPDGGEEKKRIYIVLYIIIDGEKRPRRKENASEENVSGNSLTRKIACYHRVRNNIDDVSQAHAAQTDQRGTGIGIKT